MNTTTFEIGKEYVCYFRETKLDEGLSTNKAVKVKLLAKAKSTQLRFLYEVAAEETPHGVCLLGTCGVMGPMDNLVLCVDNKYNSQTSYGTDGMFSTVNRVALFDALGFGPKDHPELHSAFAAKDLEQDSGGPKVGSECLCLLESKNNSQNQQLRIVKVLFQNPIGGSYLVETIDDQPELAKVIAHAVKTQNYYVDLVMLNSVTLPPGEITDEARIQAFTYLENPSSQYKELQEKNLPNADFNKNRFISGLTVEEARRLSVGDVKIYARRKNTGAQPEEKRKDSTADAKVYFEQPADGECWEIVFVPKGTEGFLDYMKEGLIRITTDKTPESLKTFLLEECGIQNQLLVVV